MNTPFYLDNKLSREKALQKFDNNPLLKHVLEIIDDGVTVIPADFDYQKECDKAVEAFYKFKEANKEIVQKHENENGYLHRIVNLHEKVEQLSLLFSKNKNALEVLDFFLNETIIYTSLFFERGSEQDLHRDTPYFCTRPEYSYFGFWIALEDTDENNGSLKVVKGAHKLPELNRLKIAEHFYDDLEAVDPYDVRLWMEYHRQLKEQYDAAGLIEEEVHFKKGDAVLWNPQTPHGAAKILDPKRTRLSFVMHVTPPNVPVYKQDVFFTNKDVSDKAYWAYTNVGSRRAIKHGQISFAHVENFELEQLL